MRRTKAFITGSRGFIGSHLLDELIIQDYEISPTIFDAQVIFHLSACDLHSSLLAPIKCLEVNVAQTLDILEKMRVKAEDAVLVFSSTGSVYGEPLYAPQDENHPFQPTNPYTISKVAAERYINYYAKQYGLKTVILRYYNVTGRRQKNSGVIPTFIRQILHGKPVTIEGDGSQKRCFTHVKDVVRANILAYETEKAYGSVFNIAGDEVITLNELASLVSSLLNMPFQVVHKKARVWDIHSFEPDISLARKVLGFSPKYSLKDAIFDLIGELRQ